MSGATEQTRPFHRTGIEAAGVEDEGWLTPPPPVRDIPPPPTVTACPHGRHHLCRVCDVDHWCDLHGFRTCSCWWAQLVKPEASDAF